MKPINEMTDQELAEAVAVEVLGWFDMDTEHWIAPYHDDESLGLAAYWKEIDLTVFGGVLCADGREAIEDELKRRGWDMGFWIECFNSGVTYTCRITLAPTHSVDVARTKSRYRAIAEAALMAVREEASKEYDGND